LGVFIVSILFVGTLPCGNFLRLCVSADILDETLQHISNDIKSLVNWNPLSPYSSLVENKPIWDRENGQRIDKWHADILPHK